MIEVGDRIDKKAKNYLSDIVDQIEEVDKRIVTPKNVIVGRYKRRQIAVMAKYKSLK